MKKKIMGAAIIAALAITAGWNYQQNKQSVELSDLMMANINALANNESGIPTIPCEDGGTSCTYIIKDANGKYHNASTPGMKNKY